MIDLIKDIQDAAWQEGFDYAIEHASVEIYNEAQDDAAKEIALMQDVIDKDAAYIEALEAVIAHLKSK